MKKEEIEKQITDLERAMAESSFWNDKDLAQAKIKELQELKEKLAGVGKYDKGNAILSIYAGAGGDDAEDFVAMLFSMYRKYTERKGWGLSILDDNENSQGGFRSIVAEISGKNVYGTLKHEAGVHRLVRISPFNAAGKRQTSFALVEVVPQLPELPELELDEKDLDVQFAKAGGPGGQNVNKRETAVRITHKPTNVSVHVSSERSQEQNRAKALEALRGKLFRRLEKMRENEEEGRSLTQDLENEWGNQMRSYILHPYKMVKDVRTGLDLSDPESVLDGDLDELIEAAKHIKN